MRIFLQGDTDCARRLDGLLRRAARTRLLAIAEASNGLNGTAARKSAAAGSPCASPGVSARPGASDS